MSTPENKKPEDPKKIDLQDNLFSYAKNNTRDSIAYILLIFGIILLFTLWNFWGAVLIGLVLGFYFGEAILNFLQNSNEYAEKVGFVKILIIAGTALGFFIAAPGFFIGTAIALTLKHLAFPNEKV